MRISDCSSDVCSSDLALDPVDEGDQRRQSGRRDTARGRDVRDHAELRINFGLAAENREIAPHPRMRLGAAAVEIGDCAYARSALGCARSRSELNGTDPVGSSSLDAFGARRTERCTGTFPPYRHTFRYVARPQGPRGRQIEWTAG